ncbi:hypothetical protein Tco_1439624 [Tanacetum coccineum]
MQLMRFSYRTKTIVGPEVNNMTTHIIASTWNLVDRSLTSAKITPLSGIVPSTIDTKYSVELADGKDIQHSAATQIWGCYIGKRGKLNPRYIGPFKIIAKVGTVAYRLELPEKLSRVHSRFHVSNLNKCLADEALAIPLDEI